MLLWDTLLGPHLRDDLERRKEGRKEGADLSHCLKSRTLEAGNMNLPGTGFAFCLNLPSIFNNVKHLFTQSII